MRSHATGGMSAVLLGLPEFVALSASEVAGEAELLVETTVTLTGCPRCGVVAEPHGRRAMLVQDLPAAGRPVALPRFTATSAPGTSGPRSVAH